MALLRKKAPSTPEPEAGAEPAAPADVRERGPWDSSERSVADDPSYVDLGALLVRAHDDLQIQLPTDGEGDEIGSVVLLTEEAALEIRAFAGTKSGGTWAEILADLEEEVERMGGEHDVVDGPFGREIRVKVPVQLPDGDQGFQPSRIVGIEGPRWLLRATFLGEAGLNPTDDGVLMEALRDVVVVRGGEARIAREPLLLTLPDNAVVTADEE